MENGAPVDDGMGLTTRGRQAGAAVVRIPPAPAPPGSSPRVPSGSGAVPTPGVGEESGPVPRCGGMYTRTRTWSRGIAVRSWSRPGTRHIGLVCPDSCHNCSVGAPSITCSRATRRSLTVAIWPASPAAMQD